ncbi:MAG: GIY-YIG nuclease family protein [Chitinophagaceae bacterium]
MRIKGLGAKFDPSKTPVNFDHLKMHNPKLWKKLIRQFELGRKIVIIQNRNGLDRLNENTLRYYLMEYAGRFINLGPASLPASFNTLEPFFFYNHANSIIQLHKEEESYGISLVDFLDYVTAKDFDLSKIDFENNIPEKVIFHFTFTSGWDEINFSNNGKHFLIGGLSLVRQGKDVSILMQAGENYNAEEAGEYLKQQNSISLNKFITPQKKALGLHVDDGRSSQIVNFNGRDDLWSHNIGVLFDLKERDIDLRFVARDENIKFTMLTDDFSAISGSKDILEKNKISERYNGYLNELSKYDAVFDFAKYCLAIPYYVFEKENRIVDVTYETRLNKVIKGPQSKREFAKVPPEYKVFAKPFYFLESDEQAVIKNIELDDKSFKMEKRGFWKRLNADEEGFDKRGERIIGKTWVERNDIYYSAPKGVTKAERVEIFENENAGSIYIMRQPTLEENIFKIGLTERNTQQRSKELFNTSSPDKFFIINSYLTKERFEAERRIHQELDQYRLSTRREFFRCNLKTILDTCERITQEINKEY